VLGQIGIDGTGAHRTRPLGNSGLDPDDIDAVMRVLGKYATEDPEDPTIPVGSPRGIVCGYNQPPSGAKDARRYAADFDHFGNYRPRIPPQSERQRADFEKRFPEIARIKWEIPKAGSGFGNGAHRQRGGPP
jgi:hypothetical protein